MVGIVSYGTYIPRYRLKREVISSALGWLRPAAMAGEKAVAGYDEDSLSLAVNACMQCMKGSEIKDVDCLFFATTSAPYREREGATIIADALGLPSNIRAHDVTDSLKSGTGALILASDSVKSGTARCSLVSAADCRLGKPLSRQEMVFGDAGAAIVMGSDNLIASFEDCYSVVYDFPDYWRTSSDMFTRNLEDRLIRDEGYVKFIPEAVAGLLKKTGLSPKDIAKVVFPCINIRDHNAVGKKMGFEPDQIQEPLLNVIGDSGNASPLLMLIAALDHAKPGDNIIVASHGNGSDALLFQVGAELEQSKDRREKLNQQLNSRIDLAHYDRYLAFRRTLTIEQGPRSEEGPTQLPLTWRERKAIVSLHGSKCKQCGTVHYPPQNICVNEQCEATNEMEYYKLSDKPAVLFSYTEDFLASSINPPVTYGVLDFEGGGRFVFDITDHQTGSLKVGMNMEMTFRRKYLDEPRGIYQYFWKARPLSLS